MPVSCKAPRPHSPYSAFACRTGRKGTKRSRIKIVAAGRDLGDIKGDVGGKLSSGSVLIRGQGRPTGGP